MGTLWQNLTGRARMGGRDPRGPGDAEPSGKDGFSDEKAVPRRYLAIVARDRPDLVQRVNRLFLVDQKVQAVLDRRREERRRRPAALEAERRRADRRRPATPEQDLAVQKVVIAEAAAEPQHRLLLWVEEGRALLHVLTRLLEDLATRERECAALRARSARLELEIERLTTREAQILDRLSTVAQDIARPLGEIVARLRVA